MSEIDINSLQIAKPCHENWEGMTGNDQKRHCERCQLHVIDATRVTRSELRQVVAQEGRVCLRMYKAPSGEVVTKDSRWTTRFGMKFSFALAAVLGVFGIAAADPPILGDIATPKASPVPKPTPQATLKPQLLMGAVAKPMMPTKPAKKSKGKPKPVVRPRQAFLGRVSMGKPARPSPDHQKKGN